MSPPGGTYPEPRTPCRGATAARWPGSRERARRGAHSLQPLRACILPTWSRLRTAVTEKPTVSALFWGDGGVGRMHDFISNIMSIECTEWV